MCINYFILSKKRPHGFVGVCNHTQLFKVGKEVILIFEIPKQVVIKQSCKKKKKEEEASYL